MSWKEAKITFRFVTPAFVGGADGNAELRVPPFKYLFRFWWRVAVGGPEYDHRALQKREGEIFGNAGDKFASTARLRFRLEEWGKVPDNKQKWSRAFSETYHPEVSYKGKHEVATDLYLGYGPIGSRGPTKTFINPGQTVVLTLNNDLIQPLDKSEFPLEKILKLIHWFGTMGSRSKNSWGSVEISSVKVDGNTWNLPLLSEGNLKSLNVIRHIDHALALEWPHAIGMDQKGVLVWKSDSFDRFEDVVDFLAKTKIAFRTQFKFQKTQFRKLEDRHILAYPAGFHHNVIGNKRLANQVIFKIRHADDGKYQAIAFHMPHRFPHELNEGGVIKFEQQQKVWDEVHKVLDKTPKLGRLK